MKLKVYSIGRAFASYCGVFIEQAVLPWEVKSPLDAQSHITVTLRINFCAAC